MSPHRSSPGGREDLLAARQGDAAAGRSLMGAHGASMVRTAWKVLGRYAGNDADDVVQEAFLAALTTDALPTGDVGAWLRAITVRKALDQTRRRTRRGEQSLSTEGEDSPVESSAPAASVDVIAVRRCLAQLAPLDRAVLVLVDLEGHSMAETAEVLGATRVAIKLRAVRARRRLARLLDENPVGSERGRGEAGMARRDPGNGSERTRAAFRLADAADPDLERLIDAAPGLVAEAQRRRRKQRQGYESALASASMLAARLLPRLVGATALLAAVATVLLLTESPAETTASSGGIEQLILNGTTSTDGEDLLLDALVTEGNGNG